MTVADATAVREQEQDRGGELVLRQLRAADVVVLGKCDLAEPVALAATRNWLEGLHLRARVHEAFHGDVPWQAVLDAQAGEHRTGADAHAHLEFEEWTLTTSRCFDSTDLRRAFTRLPASVVRAKGVFRAADGTGVIVQFAGGRLEISPGPPGEPGSRLVVIGRQGALDRGALDRLFASR